MKVHVETPSGTITSRRVAWQSRHDGRDVWTWRVDRGTPPLEFETVEAARSWVEDVWRDDPKEFAKSGWKVVVA